MSMLSLRTLIATLACVFLGACGGSDSSFVVSSGGGGGSSSGKVGHVFIIVLENKDYSASFDPKGDAPYLANTLTSMGQLLSEYYGIGHNSLTNYVAMVSGQSPNALTQADCQAFQDFAGTSTPGDGGQVTGQGCIYPAAVKTVADQLQAAGFSWKGYMEDMGADVARDSSATCAHPAVNTQDKTQTASATDQYATRHNPFMYFHSVIDAQANCDAHVVSLSALQTDLQNLATTPNYAFITPDLCSDGHDATCADPAQQGGLKGVNDFLSKWVPMILASPAYKKDGLLIVTFDESDSGATAGGDNTACCAEPTGPNTPKPGIQGPGGGRVGAVLISPFIRPGGPANGTPYNHYALLKSVEDIFGLPYLGYAGQTGLKAFGADVYSAP